MSTRYKHLLSPLTIGDVTLKSRICFPDACPHFLQGPESWPSANFRAFYAGLAKNGAAYIDLAEWDNPNQRHSGAPDSIRMQSFDSTDPSTDNYLSQLADEVKFYGSKLSIAASAFSMPFPKGYSFSGLALGFPGMSKDPVEMAPADMLPAAAEAFADNIKRYADCGYEMMSLNIGFFVSKFYNPRTDEYGVQTAENAARFPKLLFDTVKKRMGKNFLIECFVYGEMANSYTTEDIVAILKELEGHIDIIAIKEKDAAANHPTGYNFVKGYHPCLDYAKAIKDSGNKTPIALNGGFQDPAELDGYIERGLCDMFTMARGLFADPDYYEKVLDGKGEDVTPCLWCNKCHGTMNPPWIIFCSVNPKMGINDRLERLIPPAGDSKKVAVVGGGPIGMRVALFAAERGHKVTLFEKTGYLGGQLRHSDYVSFKWPLKNYKDWLVRQLGVKGVEVRLNTEATPMAISAGGFDAVVAATGATPNRPGFKGLDDSFMSCLDVFGNEDKLGKKVVIVGGSEVGVETGMHLCEHGHEVVVLTRQSEIAHDASKLHYITMAFTTWDEAGNEIIQCAWEKYDTFKYVVNASTTEVGHKFVKYVDGDGEHTIQCDDVVICGGMNPENKQAAGFFGSADRFYMVGDCRKVADLREGNRAALGVAAQI